MLLVVVVSVILCPVRCREQPELSAKAGVTATGSKIESVSLGTVPHAVFTGFMNASISSELTLRRRFPARTVTAAAVMRHHLPVRARP